jgi:hypothetical protein
VFWSGITGFRTLQAFIPPMLSREVRSDLYDLPLEFGVQIWCPNAGMQVICFSNGAPVSSGLPKSHDFGSPKPNFRLPR